MNAIPSNGTVVIPTWSKNHEGIYYVNREGKTQLVADTSTRIPDLFENMERNELFLLIDTNMDLGGKKVTGFEMSCVPKLGEDLVLAIEFADGTSGVYLLKFGDGWGSAVFRQSNGS